MTNSWSTNSSENFTAWPQATGGRQGQLMDAGSRAFTLLLVVLSRLIDSDVLHENPQIKCAKTGKNVEFQRWRCLIGFYTKICCVDQRMHVTPAHTLHRNICTAYK